ncbi:VanZ family protein [Romboutsia hominis]|uniref:VanZ family protein n=1 Tax=Romboutsia hominis TaxID=1507512 RepID=UPI001F06B58E|nr:VanZ family protein [Romboutsia hominis]MCH1960620.1 VanZ family protein [Romboutsia hominis]MCH1968948.1 VanZ family protein [Romboutsia hominis]
MRKKIFLALAVLWMGIIFYMSNQPANISTVQSDGVINILSGVPVLGNVMDVLILNGTASFVVRKSAHMLSYGLLSVLLFMSIYDNYKSINKTSIISLIITFLYACSDEFHQTFITGRSGEFRDVLVDSTGAIIFLLIIILITKFINKKKTIR